MSGRRKKLFGPLLYFTLASAVLITAYSAYLCYKPGLDEWNERKLLASMLRSPLAQERQSAANKLMFKGPEVAEPYFAEAARDPDAEVRALVCRSVAGSRSDVASKVPILVEAAADPDAGVRVEAARGFGRVAAEQTQSRGAANLPPGLKSAGLEALSRLLKDPSVDVRAAAIESIASFPPGSSTAADLAATGGDPEPSIRLAAARALSKINGPDDPTAIRILLELVSEGGVSQHRQAALEALKPSGTGARDRALASIASLILVEDTTLRLDAIECARALGPWASAVLPALRRATLEDDPELRAIVMQAIVAIEGRDTPRAIATLIEIVSDPALRLNWRMDASEEIRKLDPATLPKATPALIRQLADPKPATRVAASQILAKIVATTPAEVPASAVAK